MAQVIEFPEVLKLIQKNKLPREIYAPDGTLLMKPYDPWPESPLIVNRKTWRLFANYTVDPKDNEVVYINTTGQAVRIKYDPDIEEMLGYVRKVHPGATVEEVISYVVSSTIQQTGDFKDEEEFGAYVFADYITLAYLISYGLLILVK